MRSTMLREPTMTERNDKSNVRRTALWLGLLALAIYIGFIAMSVLRAN
jgi:hypothetical protein